MILFSWTTMPQHTGHTPPTSGVGYDCALGLARQIAWLYPIEHVWDMLQRAISNRQIHPRSVQELRQALIEEWAQLPEQNVRSILCCVLYFIMRRGHMIIQVLVDCGKKLHLIFTIIIIIMCVIALLLVQQIVKIIVRFSSMLWKFSFLCIYNKTSNVASNET